MTANRREYSSEKKFANRHSQAGTTENLEVHANRSVLNILPLSPGFRNFDCRHSRVHGLIHEHTHTRTLGLSQLPLSVFLLLPLRPLPLPFSIPLQILHLLLLFVGFLDKSELRAFYVQGSSWAIGGVGGEGWGA